VRNAIRQPITRPVWMILLSWGLAVLTITGLLSFWIYSNQREAEAQQRQLQLEQDRAMCAMIEVFLQGPEPVPGPNGERSRTVRAAMKNYQGVLDCDQLQSSPGPVRQPRD
jgi:hypothetical protein